MRKTPQPSELYRHDGEHERLYQLAELLTDRDERIWVWRFRQYAIVAQALGKTRSGRRERWFVLGRLTAQREIPKRCECAEPTCGAV